jgi:hypothetical protein
MSTELVEILNEQAGCNLQIVEVLERGQSGAVFVRWPDGRDSVVTTALTSIERMRQTAEILAEVKLRGIQVPAHEFLFPISDGMVAVVQERLPGASPDVVSTSHIRAIVAMNEDLPAFFPAGAMCRHHQSVSVLPRTAPSVKCSRTTTPVPGHCFNDCASALPPTRMTSAVTISFMSI